jgi:molybdopterin-binding protein
MTLSARNQLAGTIESITLGDIMAHVVINIGGQQVESIITVPAPTRWA